MAALRGFFGWLGRTSILFAVLVVAMIAYAVWTSGDIARIALQEPAFHKTQANGLDGLVVALSDERNMAEAELAAAGGEAQRSSIAVLAEQLRQSRQELADLKALERSAAHALLSAVTLDLDAILEDRKRDLRLALISKKIAGLDLALSATRDHERFVALARKSAEANGRELQRRLKTARKSENESKVAFLKATKACREAKTAVSEFDRRWWLRRQLGQRVLGERDSLQTTQQTICTSSEDLQEAWGRATDRRERQQKQRVAVAGAVTRAEAWVDNDLPLAVGDLRERAEQERQNADRTIAAKAERFWNRYGVGDILRWAGGALIVIIAAPLLIRLFCYFVLAPAAMRRPNIRLRASVDDEVAIPPSERSTTSVGVRLGFGEELLVRQTYLHTTSTTETKKTRWFLDWRAPLISFASGLMFMTRIRGEGEMTIVSAARDFQAEVTIMTLPEGASCALQPRALVAVVQQMRRPLRVTTHWRIGSLNAWLTMQLRYVVFHGPARLVLKGGRGVRVERAEQGRVFGQDQLLGFSADLAYSVTRTETFWPYFFGSEPLLKDRVEAGDGVLIIEEAPMASRHGGKIRRGIEGMADAGMKAFGI